VSRVRNSVAIADGACEARSRRDAEAMLIHRRRIATTNSPATPSAIATLFLTRDTSISFESKVEPHEIVDSLGAGDIIARSESRIDINDELGVHTVLVHS